MAAYVFNHSGELQVKVVKSDDGCTYVRLELPDHPFTTSPAEAMALAMDVATMAVTAATGKRNPSPAEWGDLYRKALAILQQPDPAAKVS